MTTDRIVAIQFRYIPCGERFGWRDMGFTKINNNEECNCEPDCKLLGEFWTFPLDFRIDMSYNRVQDILGPPTEPGVWD